MAYKITNMYMCMKIGKKEPIASKVMVLGQHLEPYGHYEENSMIIKTVPFLFYTYYIVYPNIKITS